MTRVLDRVEQLDGYEPGETPRVFHRQHQPFAHRDDAGRGLRITSISQARTSCSLLRMRT